MGTQSIREPGVDCIFDEQERFLTIKEAADLLKLPYWKISRAAKMKVIPTYRFWNTRRYVKLKDIIERMEASCVPHQD